MFKHSHCSHCPILDLADGGGLFTVPLLQLYQFPSFQIHNSLKTVWLLLLWEKSKLVHSLFFSSDYTGEISSFKHVRK